MRNETWEMKDWPFRGSQMWKYKKSSRQDRANAPQPGAPLKRGRRILLKTRRSNILRIWECCELEILKVWNFSFARFLSLRLRSFAIPWTLWNFETLEHWNFGTLDLWYFGAHVSNMMRFAPIFFQREESVSSFCMFFFVLDGNVWSWIVFFIFSHVAT